MKVTEKWEYHSIYNGEPFAFIDRVEVEVDIEAGSREEALEAQERLRDAIHEEVRSWR